jgi:hypothetical protein
MFLRNYKCVLDNDKIISVLDKYIKEHPCCNEHINCKHPKIQSDANLFNFKKFNSIKNSFFKNLNNYVCEVYKEKNYKVISSLSWGFLVLKNNIIKLSWHDHLLTNNKKNIEISGLIYLNETNLGTFFKNDMYEVYIKPQINNWYFWPSNIEHSPREGIVDQNRYVIATSTVLTK